MLAVQHVFSCAQQLSAAWICEYSESGRWSGTYSLTARLIAVGGDLGTAPVVSGFEDAVGRFTGTWQVGCVRCCAVDESRRCRARERIVVVVLRG